MTKETSAKVERPDLDAIERYCAKATPWPGDKVRVDLPALVAYVRRLEADFADLNACYLDLPNIFRNNAIEHDEQALEKMRATTLHFAHAFLKYEEEHDALKAQLKRQEEAFATVGQRMEDLHNTQAALLAQTEELRLLRELEKLARLLNPSRFHRVAEWCDAMDALDALRSRSNG